MSMLSWVVLGAALALALLAAVLLFGPYRRFRGTRVIRCPETEDYAAVEVDARHAAATGLFGHTELRLRDCTRWPERERCGQECLRQVEAAPADCLVRTILGNWYLGKACVYCGREFAEVNWLDYKPALLNPEGKHLEWPDVPPEKVPYVLATCRPVCWNCHVAETFRQTHPDLVVDRPWRHESRTGDDR